MGFASASLGMDFRNDYDSGSCEGGEEALVDAAPLGNRCPTNVPPECPLRRSGAALAGDGAMSAARRHGPANEQDRCGAPLEPMWLAQSGLSSTPPVWGSSWVNFGQF